MYWLYLPVKMPEYEDVRIPPSLEVVRPLVERALEHSWAFGYRYAYVSARKGWATPDNPLNRPGWHCDGFGTNDRNYVWWHGASTRFALQAFYGIVCDHNRLRSTEQLNEQVDPMKVTTYPQNGLYMIDPSVVHATPSRPAACGNTSRCPYPFLFHTCLERCATRQSAP
jgi:hypothetical protein